MAAMGGVIGLILLDETVVGVALPTIQRELGMSELASHWIVNAYFLVFTGLAAAGGKIGDIIGLGRLFFIGVTVFGLASVACGFAETGTWLVAARGAQGIGAAVIFPASISMVAIAFPLQQRGLALGITGSIGTSFLAMGPLVGGFFTQVLDWRWIFWINPFLVVAIAAIVGYAWIEPKRPGGHARLDGVGLALLVIGLSLLVFGVMQGPDDGWDRPRILASLAVGGVIFIGFVVVEYRKQMPLIEVDLFRNATFSACNGVVFMGQFSKMAFIIIGALYLQNTLGMDPLTAGLALLPGVVPTPITAIFVGKLADRLGARVLSLIGVSLVALSLIWTGYATRFADYYLLLPGLIVWGAAQPGLFSPP